MVFLWYVSKQLNSAYSCNSDTLEMWIILLSVAECKAVSSLFFFFFFTISEGVESQMTGNKVVQTCCSAVDLCQRLTCVLLSYSKDKLTSFTGNSSPVTLYWVNECLTGASVACCPTVTCVERLLKNKNLKSCRHDLDLCMRLLKDQEWVWFCQLVCFLEEVLFFSRRARRVGFWVPQP